MELRNKKIIHPNFSTKRNKKGKNAESSVAQEGQLEPNEETITKIRQEEQVNTEKQPLSQS